MGCSFFTGQLFLAFYILFCKKANLWDIDFNVNMTNPTKFREVSMPRSCISKIGILVCHLQTRSGVSISLFLASIWVPTCGKYFIVISFVVFEISGGCFQTLPDALNWQIKQLLRGYGVKFHLFFFFHFYVCYRSIFPRFKKWSMTF